MPELPKIDKPSFIVKNGKLIANNVKRSMFVGDSKQGITVKTEITKDHFVEDHFQNISSLEINGSWGRDQIGIGALGSNIKSVEINSSAGNDTLLIFDSPEDLLINTGEKDRIIFRNPMKFTLENLTKNKIPEIQIFKNEKESQHVEIHFTGDGDYELTPIKKEDDIFSRENIFSIKKKPNPPGKTNFSLRKVA